jgi:hypothetical protein
MSYEVARGIIISEGSVSQRQILEFAQTLKPEKPQKSLKYMARCGVAALTDRLF